MAGRLQNPGSLPAIDSTIPPRTVAENHDKLLENEAAAQGYQKGRKPGDKPE
jgi:hypothetical protein